MADIGPPSVELRSGGRSLPAAAAPRSSLHGSFTMAAPAPHIIPFG